jgi:methyl-accepting chemotaxis protein
MVSNGIGIGNIVTVVITIWILVLFFKSISKNSNKNYKNEIVSLGVLGTFIGITIGLYHFNTLDLKNSMPHLLEGLKTAFTTSGVGIFFSIIISMIKPPIKPKASLDILVENQEKIIETLEKPLQHISKTVNDEILNSLQKIITDFNNNLDEQFGENFKQLNQAVEKMIIWQDNYKNQIMSYENNINKMLINMGKIAEIQNEQKENIDNIINDLSSSSKNVTESLKEATEIVKESLDLLLREANGRL